MISPTMCAAVGAETADCRFDYDVTLSNGDGRIKTKLLSPLAGLGPPFERAL